ncbi:Putative glycosyltransferase [gamma proteobacterium HdN1]|nr:Putative glycosyltransferase [gamma proteobacterium HdN1]
MRGLMKTVLHIIDTTGPGGAETVFAELATAAAESGRGSLALIRGPGWVMDELQRRGIETIVLDCKGSLNIRFLLSLVSLIRRRKITLIHSHLLGSNVYASLAGWLTRVPVISTFHGSVDVQGRERFLAAKFGSINLGSRVVVAVTERLSRDLRERTPISAKKLQVIYNGIDTERFSLPKNRILRERLGLPDGALLVGALGNIRAAKDYMVAVQAIAILRQRGVDVHLAIAGQGSGPLKDELDAFCLKEGITDRIHLLGFVDDAPMFLAGIDLFMLSSSSEGHPLAITQAMSMALPIAATLCGVEEVLQAGEDALLVEPKSPEKLADALQTLAFDKGVCERLGAQARESVLKRYSLKTMKAGYLGLYQKLEK